MQSSLNNINGLKRHDCLLSLAVLMGFSILIYARVFGYDWTYDDFIVIVDNPDVRSLSAFFSDSYPGRPLRELTFILDYRLFGMDPAGWHLQNLLWHSLDAFLILWLVRLFGASSMVAWGAALLFLCHPIQVEAVASISHRKESLVLAFSLGAMIAYLVAPDKKRPWRWYLFAGFFYLVACQAKQIAVLLPVVLYVYEICFLPVEKRVLYRYRWLLAGASVLVGIAGLVWFFGYGGEQRYREWAEILLIKLEYSGDPSIATYLQMVFKSWAFMALRLFYPVNLAVEYLYPVPLGWADPWVVAGFLLPIAWLVGLYLVRCKPIAVFSLAWAGVFWLPTSNIWPLAYPAADRYLYTPMLGVSLFLVSLLVGGERLRSLRSAALIICLVFCTYLSWQQIQYWQSDKTVYQHALEVSPNSSFLYNELGKVYEKEGDVSRALKSYRSAVRINNRNAAAHYNLGKILEYSGFIQQALNHYAQFLTLGNKAYAEAETELRRRLKRQYGLKLQGTD